MLRPYLEVTPTDRPVDPGVVARAFTDLHYRLRQADRSGLSHAVRRTARRPVVEWLLVGDGRPDTSIRYLLGCSPDALLDEVEAIARVALPDSYELRRVHWHPHRITDDVHSAGIHSADVNTEDSRTDVSARSAGRPHSGGTQTEAYVAGVEYRGRATLRRDYLTPLTPLDDGVAYATRRQRRIGGSNGYDLPDGATGRRGALAGLVEQLRSAGVPVVYQVVTHAVGDRHGDGVAYADAIERGAVTVLDHVVEAVWPRTEEAYRTYAPPPGRQARIDGIADRDLRHPFCVSARAAAVTHDDPERADAVARSLASALDGFSGPTHRIEGRVRTDDDLRTEPLPPGSQLLDAVADRRVHGVAYDSLATRLPWRPHASRGILMAPAELAAVCVVDGAGLTPHGERALETRPAERTGIRLPPPRQLEQYAGSGQALCMPLTHDREPYGHPLVIPPRHQDRHLIVVGDTGAGKSVLTEGAMLSNVRATTGPDILLDYKGGGTATDYLQAQYAAHDSLDDVLYFDLARTLPAFSFFDIRPLLDAGLSREEARSRKAGHYEEILAGLLGTDRYYSATESTKAIRNHLRALYDPIHGTDAPSHRDLYDALQRTLADRTPPPTSSDRLTEYFAGLLERDREIFLRAMGGAVSRVETIATDDRLAPLFDHAHHPSDTADVADTADTDTTDTGDATDAADTTDTADATDAADTTDTTDTPDGVDIPESPDTVDVSDESLGSADGHATMYAFRDRDGPHFDFADVVDRNHVVVFDFGGMERSVKRALTLVILSNLWTALKARTQQPTDQRLTTPDDPAASPLVNLYLEEASDVAATNLVDTLLSQGRSFGLSLLLGVQYPGQLDTPDPTNDTYREALNETATFVVGNVSVDDDLPAVLATDDMPPAAVARRLGAMRRGEWLVRPATDFGHPLPRPFLAASLPYPNGHPDGDHPLTASQADRFRTDFERAARTTARYAGIDPTTEPRRTNDSDRDSVSSEHGSETDTGTAPGRLDSLLPYTRRLPHCVTYDEPRHALSCTECGTRYDPTIDGMRDAISCCHSLADVDRDDVPACATHLKLSRDELERSDWSATQLRFLQTVWNAQQRRYHSLEYDITHDSMIRLREYADIDIDAVTDLLDADLLRTDTTKPHLLYSVSAAGRDAIGEHLRDGVDYGHGKGDLGESSEHVMLVELATALAEQYRDDLDHPVQTVEQYYDLDDGHRLDVVGLDHDRDIVLTIEAERINNDHATAAPNDYDKMADCRPHDAIWVVPSLTAASQLTHALHDPAHGTPRIDRTYSPTTQTAHYAIDEPGFTAIHTATALQHLTDHE